MPLLQPKPSDMLFERITEKAISGEHFSSFDEAQIKAEIMKNIMPSRPDEAHSALGALAQCQGNEGEMRKHFRVALQLEPDSPEIHYNYARALAFIGAADEAREQLHQAFNYIEHDTYYNDSFVELAAGLGEMELAAKIAERGLSLNCPDGLQWIAPDVLIATTTEVNMPSLLEGMFTEEALRKHSVTTSDSAFNSLRDFANKIREHV